METQVIVNELLSNDVVKRRKALEVIYEESFRKVESFIVKNNGLHSEASDIFQEGVTVLFQNIHEKKFEGKSSIHTYLFSICKNLWLLELRKKKILITNKSPEETIAIDEVEEVRINVKTLKSVVLQLKPACQKILMGFYFENKSMKELAVEFKLSGTQAAKNKKSRCLKRLTQIVEKLGLKKQNFYVD